MSSYENAVVLRAGAWRAEVLPDFGMNTVSLRCGERMILREADSMKVLLDSPFLYGTPLLFPANRTANGCFTFEGKTYHLPVNEPDWNNHLHGLMYDAPFTVISRDECSVMAVYENDGARYPFPFRIEMRDTLNEKGWQRTVNVLNTGEGGMPYTMAFHTAFAAPARFAVEIGLKHERSDTFVPTGHMLKLDEWEENFKTGAVPEGMAISGYFHAAGTEAVLDDIRFTMSEGFDQRVLFNGGGHSGFLCIEPQAGWVNGLNMPGCCKVLEPGKTHTYQLTIGKV